MHKYYIKQIEEKLGQTVSWRYDAWLDAIEICIKDDTSCLKRFIPRDTIEKYNGSKEDLILTLLRNMFGDLNKKGESK